MHTRNRDPLTDQRLVNASAHVRDHANSLGPANRRGQVGLIAILAADRPKIVVVDRRHDHLDQNLTRCRIGCRRVDHVHQLDRIAKSVVNCSAHRMFLGR